MLACVQSLTGPDEAADGRLTPSQLSSCSPTNFGGFEPKWTCSTTVNLYAGNSTHFFAALEAAQDWQAATAGTALPTLAISNDSMFDDGTIVGAHTGSTFCGKWNKNTNVLTIEAPPTQCASDLTSTLVNIFRHELGHALGWTASDIHGRGETDISDHCVMYTLGGSINTSICAHEIEGALAAYGLRSLPSNFWSKQFVVGSAASIPADTVDDGDTLQLPSPGNWVVDGAGQVTGSYTWASSNTAIATVSSSGVVTGISPGTVTITAYPGSSSTYLFTKRFLDDGTSTTVTVLPVEEPMVTIQGITHSGNPDGPIQSIGSYLFSAVLGSGDTTGVKYRWIFKDSRTPNDSLVVGDTLPPYTFGFRDAWYTIDSIIPTWTLWVKVIAMRDSTLGSFVIREWPVCPGEEMLRMDEENNAAGGC